MLTCFWGFVFVLILMMFEYLVAAGYCQADIVYCDCDQSNTVIALKSGLFVPATV